MRLLAAVSAAQLMLGLAGLAKELRSRGSFDIGIVRGSPATIERDQWITSTSLSAPGLMLRSKQLVRSGSLHSTVKQLRELSWCWASS